MTDGSDDGRLRAVVDAFTDAWWHGCDTGGTWLTTTWLGVPIWKHPFDLMIMQEIVWETRPTLIVESGTNRGGSALFFASLLDLLGEGTVLTTDVEDQPDKPSHPRIEYRLVSGTSEQFVDEASRLAASGRTMVVLDSDHRAEHVRRELELLSPLVSPGCYLVCEDGCVNGHPILPDWGPGPLEAIRDFLATHPEFEADRHRERLLSTFNPSGYLRRAG